MKEVKKKEKIDLKQKFYELFWLFLLGSLFGCIYETIICILITGQFEFRQGLIYGPLIPIYGIGALILVLVAVKKKHLYSIFLSSAIFGGLTEYVCSLIQENVFGTISWSYQKNWLNFDGRTSPYHMLIWGVLGILFIKFAYPHIKTFIIFMLEKRKMIITHILVVFIVFDILISYMACSRQTERDHQIPATNAIQRFLDQWYPDSFLDTIYANKKIVKK